MGLIGWILDHYHPTRHWEAEPGFELVLDLDHHRLCGCGLGDSMGDLQRLGPAEDIRASRRGFLRYPSLGVEISCQEGAIESVAIHWASSVYGDFRPYPGKVYYQGREVEMGRRTTIEEYAIRFGEPYWRDTADEDESILFYELGALEWEVEFDASGLLRCLLIVSPPLLEDEEQRRNYGVDKPWPPESRTAR